MTSVRGIASEIESAWQLRDEQPKVARAKIQSILESLDDEHLKARCLTLLAFLTSRDNNFEEAVKQIYQARDHLERANDSLWTARLLNVFAVVHHEVGNKHHFLALMQQALKLAHKINDYDRLFAAYHDLGSFYQDQNPDKAIEHFLKAKTYVTEYHQEAFLSMSIGLLYGLKAEDELAELNLFNALKLAQENGNLRIESMVYLHLTTYFLKKNDFDLALAHNKKAIISRKKCDDSTAEEELQLAQIYFAKNDLMQAQTYAKHALEAFLASGHQVNLPQVYLLMSQIYKTSGDFVKALESYEAYVNIQNKLNSEEQQKKQRVLEVLYETEALKREAQLLEEKNLELEQYIEQLKDLNEQVIELSIRDPLTFLYNRRYLFEQAENVLKQAKRYGRELTVAMLDIDHFKSINDRFFHKAGDQALIVLAGLLQNNLRDADIVARYGGEEFALLLPETALKDAALVCERLRKTIEDHDWSVVHPELKLTVSIGLASDISCQTIEELFTLADKQLYKAKDSGRNQLAF